MKKHRLEQKHQARGQQGIALIVCLLALLLLSAIAMGMMYSANMETTINTNYRDSQRAFFGARAGLQEARERMRPKTALGYVAPPAVMPGTGPGSIVYILNPDASGRPVQPWDAADPYFDDELCHENFAGLVALGITNTGASVPCNTSLPASQLQVYNSIMPLSGAAGALSYRWVRITLKANNSTGANCVNGNCAISPNTQVCYTGSTEQLLTGYPDCATAASKTSDQFPVYIVTALAVICKDAACGTFARRMEQYEVATVNFPSPPSALTIAGPGTSGFYMPPNSNNFGINGNDPGPCTGPNTPAGCYNGPAMNPPCTANGNLPTIGGFGPAAVSDIIGSPTPSPGSGMYAQGTKPANYVSGTNTGSATVGDVTTTVATPLSTPSTLDAMVNNMATAADNLITTNTTSNPANFGTPTNPLVTVVEGNASFSGKSSQVPTGAGILVVTGDLVVNGDFSWDGVIYVVGQGSFTVSGAGSGTYVGAIYVAKTKDAAGNELATLGTPTVNWSGGGNGYFYYNSCWANGINSPSFTVVAAREEMY